MIQSCDRELKHYHQLAKHYEVQVTNLQSEVEKHKKWISGINSTLLRNNLLKDKRLPKSEPSGKSSESSNLDIEKIL